MDSPERNNKPLLGDILDEIKGGNLPKIQLARALKQARALISKKFGPKFHSLSYLSKKTSLDCIVITETMRLLELCPAIQQLIEDGRIPISATPFLLKERKRYEEKLDGNVLARIIQELPQSVESIRIAVKKTLEETGVYNRNTHPYQKHQVSPQFTRDYGGLIGEPVIIIDPLDPDYEDLLLEIGPGEKEVLVALVGRRTKGRVSKVLKEALIPFVDKVSTKK